MSDYRSLTSQPIAVRNNNPGDITYDGTQWQGMGNPNNDGTFIIFSDSLWGLRALALDLVNTINGGANTITLLITQYSPPSQNNTTQLIANMSSNCGIDANAVLGTDAATLDTLMTGIIIQEIGQALQQQYYPDADIQKGISMMSNQVLSTLQAAIVYAQEDPLIAVSVVGGVAALVYLLVLLNTDRR